MKPIAVVLAAGEGKRMKSDIPKVLHPLCEKPLLAHVLDAVRAAGVERSLVVVGRQADQVREALPPGTGSVLQERQLGTGDAVAVAMAALPDEAGDILVLPGDAPLITAGLIARLLGRHRESGADVTMLTAVMDDPRGYGRVLRDADGRVERIVEDSDIEPGQEGLSEVNASMYVFRREPLDRALERLEPANAQQEYYLTDAVPLVREGGGTVEAVVAGDPREILGINSRAQLAEVAAIMRERINRHWMDEGVTLEDPSLTYIGAGVSIGRDTVIRPLTFLSGDTVIGRNCLVGPASRLENCRIADGATVTESVLRECGIGEGAVIGPFTSVRPGTVVEAGGKLGSFVEVKKSRVGRGSKIPHLSYIGDADIGENANVGAGTITCNYDGEKKHRTVIEDDAFIGSDTMLVAPVRIGKGAVTGAGSAIAKDVPEGALGIERSKQKNIPGWRNRKGRDEGDNP
ncbi:MAG: bifunctional UDP-N-acetylglucosamine diphosphorylase/glucosamine-1-phosphate N-acetyltransferase GlmU [Candidatus Geothermincolia bacterium]